MSHPEYAHLLVDIDQGVGLIRLNRPQVLNALNAELMTELIDALTLMDKDDQVRCIVLTGNERAFAAGADIGEMAEATVVDMYVRDNLSRWDRVRKVKKPIIAAVNGYALGGGCELAMACDMIIAGEGARFGQPEINIGVIPGAGGTQRLTRAIGKAKAMEWILTGRFVKAEEAERAGLVTRVVPDEAVLDEALRLAREIASKPPVAVQLAKDAVLAAFDTTIETGLAHERHNFYLLFATEDQREGMRAFLEKRRPQWRGR
ncbi:MAG TPA: enoyl-CoA hydratase-related protein [Bacillota bacterium]